MKRVFILLTWAGFTFASHYYAKLFLTGSSHFAIGCDYPDVSTDYRCFWTWDISLTP